MAVEVLTHSENAVLARCLGEPLPGEPIYVCEAEQYKEHVELEDLLDPITGLPYPLMPADSELPLDDGELADWHHGFHPRLHPMLLTLGGKALRSAQIQLVRRDRHNHSEHAYHRFNAGPYIHRAVGHQLGAVLLASAGVRHRYGVTVRDNKMWLETMTEEQANSLQVLADPKPVEPRDLVGFTHKMGFDGLADKEIYRILVNRRQQEAAYLYRNLKTGYSQTRDLMLNCVLTQDMSNVNKRLIKRFLATGDSAQGQNLLVVAVHELVRSSEAYDGRNLNELYNDLHRAGMLNPHMPPRATELVKRKLGTPRSRQAVLPVFADYLAEQMAV